MLTSVCPSTLTDLFEEIEEMATLFYTGILADDLDSEREEYVVSHIDLLKTLNPAIVGLIYRRNGRDELAIIRFKDHVIPVNISRIPDEKVTNILMDYAWNCVRR